MELQDSDAAGKPKQSKALLGCCCFGGFEGLFGDIMLNFRYIEKDTMFESSRQQG